MIIGHKNQLSLLLKAKDNLSHALIFSGESALGKKQVALKLIKEMAQKDLSYPDLISIEPEKGVIPIERIREIQKGLSFKAPFQAVLVDDAEKMNSFSQNCFLKTLEEPKGNVFFFLITSFPEMLLPTVKSRCHQVKFYPLSALEMEKGFEKEKSNPHFKEIIALSEGRPGIAFQFFQDNNLFLEKQKAKKRAEELFKKDLPERFGFAKRFFEEEEKLFPFLEEMSSFLRQELLGNLNDLSLIKKIKEVEDLKIMLRLFNINQRLAFENLLLKI